MREYKSAVRMGALNLLVLVIALCLVVLSVLALVSANSMSSFTDKQEASSNEYYTQQVAGQSFMSSLDAAWTDFARDDKHDITQISIDGILSAALNRAEVVSAGLEVTGQTELVDVEELYQMMSIPYKIRGQVSERNAENILASDDPSYSMSIAKALENCEKGVTLNIGMESGRQLNALIGLVKGGGIVVLKWQSDREWQPEGEELWMPEDGTSLVSEEDLMMFEGQDADGGEESGLTVLNEDSMGAEMDVASSE